MNKPLVTISVSMYKNLDGLKKTIPSIMMQDYANAEIILSEDGSDSVDISELEEVAVELRKKYTNVIVNKNETNLGTVKHLNRIFSMSHGKYFFDISPGDAFVSEDVVSSLVDAFEKKGHLIITSRRADEYEDGRIKVRPKFFTGFILRFFPTQLKNYMLKKKNILSGCGTFYSRALFEKYGGFDEQYKLVEDYTYYVMLLDKKAPFGWLGKTTVSHEMGGVSNGEVHPLVYQDIELLKKNYGINV